MVSGYVLTLIPVLAVAVVMLLLSAPRLFATAYDSFGVQYDKVGDALDGGSGFGVAAGCPADGGRRAAVPGDGVHHGAPGLARRQGRVGLVRR